jgi:hypothetical protein
MGLCVNAGQEDDHYPRSANPNVLWFAPFLSGGGYCSEALSFVQALHENNVSVRAVHHGDSISDSFVAGLPALEKNLLRALSSSPYATGGIASAAIVRLHISAQLH